MLLLINGRKERRCRSVGWKNRLPDRFVEDVKDGLLSAAVVGKKKPTEFDVIQPPRDTFVVSTQTWVSEQQINFGWEQSGEL